jgi:hypothetical protein
MHKRPLWLGPGVCICHVWGLRLSPAGEGLRQVGVSVPFPRQEAEAGGTLASFSAWISQPPVASFTPYHLAPA